MLLLENTAEKNSVGSSFEHIRGILDGIENHRRTGVCFDTCHAFAAGYGLRTETGIAETLAQFDDQIGISNLKIIHLNDSKGDRGSGLDRHEHIGMGFIGENGFRNLLSHPIISSVPLICETPVDDRRDDAGNIAKVRGAGRIIPRVCSRERGASRKRYDECKIRPNAITGSAEMLPVKVMSVGFHDRSFSSPKS